MPVQWFTELFPATHYIRVSRAIYLRGEGPLDLALELTLLTRVRRRALRARASHARRRGHDAASPHGSNVLAVAYKETLVLRHDRAFMSPSLAQPVDDAAAVRLRALEHARRTCRGRCSTAAPRRCRAASSRRSRRPATSSARRDTELRRQGRELLRRGDALAVLVIPRDFRRDVERGDAPRCSSCSTAPTRSRRARRRLRRPRSRRPATSAAHIPRDRGAERARSPHRRAPALLVQPDAARPRLLPRRARRHAAHQPLPVGVEPRPRRRARERDLRADAVAARPTLEIVLGKLLPLRRSSATLLLVVAMVGSGVVFGFWPRGSWLALGVVTLPFVLASLAIGVFVSTISASRRRRPCSSRCSSSCRRSCSRA